jgi:hypothetical protein
MDFDIAPTRGVLIFLQIILLKKATYETTCSANSACFMFGMHEF